VPGFMHVVKIFYYILNNSHSRTMKYHGVIETCYVL
jgi:hypothetical protein